MKLIFFFIYDRNNNVLKLREILMFKLLWFKWEIINTLRIQAPFWGLETLSLVRFNHKLILYYVFDFVCSWDI